ncbi:dsRNA-specific ribonuclease [Nitrosospira briensis]|uniref:DsRNA-specific ribonuclease n=2 Tax=Nitrosospira briensis TaxID=35799 RepID=A0A1I5CWK9_9PROT|nr:dsRNA-specific ribonuclease [Nitrosospira briensis]SFO43457.1 dsRNA-specific ribonuclease [Nitrosospira briensis]
MYQSLQQPFFTRLGQALIQADLVAFGNGVTDTERLSNRIHTEIASQFIGACAHLAGYNFVASTVLPSLASLRDFSVSVAKDSKSILQEATQAQRLGVPKYSLLEKRGEAHDATFIVQAEVPSGKKACGEARSKKLAEQEAAGALLRLLFPRLADQRSIPVAPATDIPKLANAIEKLPNDVELRALAGSLSLPTWATKLLGLAFVHCSYPEVRQTPTFGRSNKLLAFLGSFVLQWAIRDFIIRTSTIEDIQETGGLANRSAALSNQDAFEQICKKVLPKDACLVGHGEKSLRASIIGEFFQSFMAVVFLAREQSITSSLELLKRIPDLDHYLRSNLATQKTRDNTLSPKTLLNERCQAIGVSVRYETKSSVGDTVYVKPAVCFQSPVTEKDLCIVFPEKTYLAHEFEGNRSVESQCARTLLSEFNILVGAYSLNAEHPSFGSYKSIRKWFSTHLVKTFQTVNKEKFGIWLKRMGQTDVLGLDSASKGNFQSFHGILSGLLIEADGGEDNDFSSFYDLFAQAGRESRQQILVKFLVEYLDRLQALLNQLDPLSVEKPFQEYEEFRKLTEFATAFKLRGRAICSVDVSDLKEQVEIIFRRRRFRVESLIPVGAVIQEPQGSHLALIDLLTRLLESLGNNEGIIQFCCMDFYLRLSISVRTHTPIDLEKHFLNNPVWCALNELLPITSVTDSGLTIELLIPSLPSTRLDSIVWQCWGAYHQMEELDSRAYDSIAATLHDMKNELLAFSDAAQRARIASEMRARYSLAADGSRHIDAAKEKISGIRSLARSSVSLEIAPLELGSFIRSVVSETWALVPEGIAFIPPGISGKFVLWSSESGLRSVLSNLLRNAVEASGSEGKVAFEYLVDPTEKTVTFEITDSSSGFTDQQLAALNSGLALESSKKSGQGIGLLTVLVIMKELHGRIRFERMSPGGSRVFFDLPSLEPAVSNAAGEDEVAVTDVAEFEKVMLE